MAAAARPGGSDFRGGLAQRRVAKPHRRDRRPPPCYRPRGGLTHPGQALLRARLGNWPEFWNRLSVRTAHADRCDPRYKRPLALDHWRGLSAHAGGVLMADNSGRIEIAGLSKTFGTTRAVDDLSFAVEPGSVTAFLGPNGAGKTTTLRMLLGLVAPNAGTATIGGQRYFELHRPNDLVGAVLESSSFHPGRSGRNHLRVYCTVNGYPDRRAGELLELVGLAGAADRTVRGYSLGMRQRLGLAAALLGDPHVLILDEPANGLDPPGIAWLRGFLRTLAEQGRTILVSSHVLSEVQQTADRVVIINQGRLVREGTLEELSAGHGQTVRVRSPQAERLAAALRAKAAEGRVGGSHELHVTGLDAPEVGHVAFVEQVELHALEKEQGDLEQIFFALTGMGAEPDVAATGGGRQ